MGLNVKPTAEHLRDVNKSIKRRRRDGDDEHDVDPRSAKSTTHPKHRLFDDDARKIGLYRVRSQPFPLVASERDNCIQPFASRYGLGYIDGISKGSVLGGVIANCTSATRWRRGEFIILMLLKSGNVVCERSLLTAKST